MSRMFRSRRVRRGLCAGFVLVIVGVAGFAQPVGVTPQANGVSAGPTLAPPPSLLGRQAAIDNNAASRSYVRACVDGCVLISTTPTPAPTTHKPVLPPAPKPTAKPKPPVNYGPIPASCKVYTGNRALGCKYLLQAGYGLSQMPCLDKMWTHESNWRTTAKNPSSGAYGIPQSLPGSKMGTVAGDWATNPATQIIWGLRYIKARYGSPCQAWGFWQQHNWY